MTEPIRIANCSGFFGDRPSGATEMVEGGPIDVLTGDWLAELTMLILSRIQAKRPGQGFARTFVNQMEQVMGTCLDRGIKVVSNAGGLDPDGCADAVHEVASKLGLSPTIAYIDGDDLLPRIEELADSGALRPFSDGASEDGSEWGDVARFVSANAYLGCFGIVDALTAGADIVITGRVTDAAVVCGPAAWHHGWQRDDFDQLAGGVVAGHVIECSAQATGGNYSFFHEIEGRGEIGGRARFGFPWADVAADGSSIIGKHDGTGGAVTVGTVTSQLLYEIGGPRYLGPDVTARFDSIELDQVETDRVRISGVRGEAPPSSLKVAMNEMGGYRNSFSVALTGLDIDEKAELAAATFWDACPYRPEDFDSIDGRVIRTDKPDPATQEEATAIWRVTVKDADERKVGRAFADANVHTGLASIPGMYGLGGGPSGASPFGVYRPASIDSALVPQYVHILGGATSQVESAAPTGDAVAIEVDAPAPLSWAETATVALGTIVGSRSGDKGGNANLGVFVRSADAFAWLDEYLTVDRLRELLPEVASFEVDRYRFPKIWSLNFVIHGLLQEGVAASTRQDAQAKAVGEWLRARLVEIPVALLG
ncbi:acyclic terpene utilization AtuA family protein [Ilumatobacter nonamiensis]|uniref:acyclic terpene utilization AtuA family protein n=1 Tax=Ilumatobacter nonamiensis TaxID=467093 RepID=UPI000349160F|nr:acyclic terpene utilization AtuA family protein [Ilumatobacter nonamiensis]